MAGTNLAFNASEFRTSIRQTMEMGMPTAVGDRLTWHWNRDRTFNPDDPVGNPYAWTQPTVTDVPGNPDEPDGSLVVTYALEFSSRLSSSDETPLGQFDTSRAVVTLLDEEYALISSADYASISGSIYEIDFSGPPMGLFEVTVHQVYLSARDEA